ncbi:MAG TPA: hypothetical protein VMD30_01210 [Tepidisphaeraceae bacterium]|nr:hypothetical protein [Tepidisphaeraceae bacterium]
MAAVLVFPFLAGLIGAVTAGLLVRRKRGEQQANPEPACGHCGYCVRGIASLTCPECGSDLREVGIVTPKQRRNIPVLSRLVIWTLGLSVSAVMISVLLVKTVLPVPRILQARRAIFTYAPFAATFQVSGSNLDWRPQVMSHLPVPPEVLTVIDQSSWRQLKLNLKTGEYSYSSRDGSLVHKSDGLNAGVLTDWLAADGASVRDPRVHGLADDILQSLKEMGQSRNSGKVTSFYDGSGRLICDAYPINFFPSYDNVAMRMAVFLSLAIVWLCVWLWGVRRIRRRFQQKSTDPAMA